MNNFLSAQRRETHQNAPIVVTIFTDILAEISNQTDKVKVLLNTTIITLFEHAMMVDENLPSRTMVFDFFGNLFKSTAYMTSPETRYILHSKLFLSIRCILIVFFNKFRRNLIISNLKTLTTKNLSYYSTFYFQFILKFSKINSGIVLDVLPHIREQVEHVEKIRSAGTDIKLR